MANITISKEEYQNLKQQAKAYQKLSGSLFESIIRDHVEEVVEDFRRTNIYTDGFLRDLENGLRKSSYARATKR